MRPGVHVLVTGFGPFPKVRVNPTADLAKRVAASPRARLLGIRVTDRIFQTSYAAVEAVPAMLAALAPDACLHLGLAPRASQMRVELRARNGVPSLTPDRRGSRQGQHRPLHGQGPDWRSTAPTAQVLRALRRARTPARLSQDAGRYLCNALYVRALHAARSAMPSRPVVFIHVPWPAPAGGKCPTSRCKRRRPHAAAMATALVEVVLLLAAEQTRRRRAEVNRS